MDVIVVVDVVEIIQGGGKVKIVTVSIVSVLLAAAGCSSSTPVDVTREVVPAAVESGLMSAVSRENSVRLQMLADIFIARLAAPENREHLEEIASAVTKGFQKGLWLNGSSELKKQKDLSVVNSAELAAQGVMKELRESLPGLIQQLASDPRFREALGALSKSAGEGALEGAGESVSE